MNEERAVLTASCTVASFPVIDVVPRMAMTAPPVTPSTGGPVGPGVGVGVGGVPAAATPT